MFGGTSIELVVIAVVALVVIGPERMPGVARTVGALLGRAQRYLSGLKAEIQREADFAEFEKMRSSFYDAAKDVREQVAAVEASLQESRAAALGNDAQLSSARADAASVAQAERPSTAAGD